MRSGERLAVTIVDLDDEGAGVSAAPRIHVAGALPGERVQATVAHVSPHGEQSWADLQAIEVPSAARREPVCAAFGACGGCVLQHLDYEPQLVWKRARVVRALAGYPALAPLAVDATVASPRLLGYRNKSKLVAARAGGSPTGRLILGAYAPRSHDVVELTGCRIAEPPLDDTAAALRRLLHEAGVRPYDERTLVGELRHVVLRANHEGRVLVAWIVTRPLPNGEALARRLLAERPEIVGVVEHENRTRGNAIFGGAGTARVLAGTGTIDEELQTDAGPLRLRLSPDAFFQANRWVAALAYGAIARGLEVAAHERVIDAYGGVGGIALALARHAREVIGVEAHPGAVADAVASAALNGISNARFVVADAGSALATLDGADVVVLNPPRKGCAPSVLAEVVRLGPRAIAYLSCDPDTLARDLGTLATGGYRPRTVTPFDMLPHTPHVEVLALLARLPGPASKRPV